MNPLAIAGIGFGLQTLSNLLSPRRSGFSASAINNQINAAYGSGAQNVRQAVGAQNQLTAARLAQAGLGSSGMLARQIGLNEQAGQNQLLDLLAQLEGYRAQMLQRSSEFDALLKQQQMGQFGQMGAGIADLGLLSYLIGMNPNLLGGGNV